MSAFLERARELDETKADGWAKADEFRLECWPEIQAVIEAAQEVERKWSDCSESPKYRRNRLWHALDALDRAAGKAGER